MSSQEHKTIRLDIWVSNIKPIAVLLVRFNKKSLNRLILWNLSDNSFIRGQWLTKAIISPSRSMISPEGDCFAYAYDCYSEKHESYTILSKPPFFTATTSVYGDSYGARYRNYNGQKQLSVALKEQLIKGKHAQLFYDKDIPLPTYIDCDNTPRFNIKGFSYEYDKTRGLLTDSESILLNVFNDQFECIKAPYESDFIDEII